MKWTRIAKYVIMGLLGLIAILALWWAFLNAQKAGQSRQVLKDGRAIQQALEYFYQDQNRYPSTDEFTDQNLMRQYLSGFPPQEFASKTCPKPATGSSAAATANTGLVNFKYVNSFRNDYELRLCLPQGVQGFGTGWNKFIAPPKS